MPLVMDYDLIALHMGVQRLTPQQWRQRGLLPPLDFPEVKAGPLWLATTIKTWAHRTNRAWYDNPELENPGWNTRTGQYDDAPVAV